MITFYDCPVCGQKVSKALNNCPNCGCPTKDMGQKQIMYQPNMTRPKAVNNSKNKSKVTLIVIIAVLLIAAGVATFIILKKSDDNSKKGGGDTKQSIEDDSKDEKTGSVDVVKQYKEDYKSTFNAMIDGAVEAEEFGHFYHDVWYNSIYKEDDEKTDKYTKDDSGEFYDDFNDALSQVYADYDQYQKLKSIEDNQSKVQGLMKKLINPPDECKEAYDAIKEMYDHYIELTNLVRSPQGYSLQSYTEGFNNADTATANCVDKVGLYID